MIRAISHWATAAMAAVAGTALVYLLLAFLPLADLWAARDPGPHREALAAALRIGGWGLLFALAVTTAVATAGWAARARSNLVAFGLRSRRLARGRTAVLVWLLWGSAFAGAGAALLGLIAGLDDREEIADVRGRVAAGHPIDHDLAAHLFGRQLVLGLPSAALFVLAAAVAVLLIGRVTGVQCGRIARLRAALAVAGGTIGA
ncbi:hypothetical protein [Dactylosporangium salmoneum]|uniref:Uncharacterized protein n=1 Tax=Dactylosporangium salmoneum TaxID=53361 RepID=A0ABP5V098_9ACTN